VLSLCFNSDDIVGCRVCTQSKTYRQSYTDIIMQLTSNMDLTATAFRIFFIRIQDNWQSVHGWLPVLLSDISAWSKTGVCYAICIHSCRTHLLFIPGAALSSFCISKSRIFSSAFSRTAYLVP